MAETIPDLTDTQIEALLSAAEVSLAQKTPAAETAVAVKDKQRSIAVTATPFTNSAMTDTKAGKDAVKHAELALRVPQPKIKNKKVCQPFPLPFTLSYEENTSHFK